MRINEIRKLNQKDLQRELENSREELFNLRFRLSTRQLVNHCEIGSVKKKIARIKTVMRETEQAGR